MKISNSNTSKPRAIRKILSFSIMALSVAFSCSPALADESQANNSIAGAGAKIEMATRQAGVAGNQGDQSYNMSRERFENSKLAFAKGNYDSAEMLADESALLSELTSEKAKLAALTTSNNALLNTNAQISGE